MATLAPEAFDFLDDLPDTVAQDPPSIPFAVAVVDSDDADDGDSRHDDIAGQVTADSRSVAVWTILSRVTGFARVIVISAVLGPTFFGNLFQSANQLPWVLYELAVGSLLASLFVPPLVAHLDRGDTLRTQQLARRFLGLVLVGFGAVTILVIVLSPLLAQLLGIGVHGADDHARFIDAAIPLLVLTSLQLVGYGFISTGVAVQNAHGRFGFAAAAPAIENLQ